jgi:hypothetical protein
VLAEAHPATGPEPGVGSGCARRGLGFRGPAAGDVPSAIVLIKKLRPIRRDHQRRGVAERHLVSWRTLPAEGR